MDRPLPSSDPPPNLTPVELAGWLLAVREQAVANGLTWPSVDEIFAATNARRQDAYAIADAIIGRPESEHEDHQTARGQERIADCPSIG